MNSDITTPTTPAEMITMIMALQQQVIALQNAQPQRDRLKMKEPELFSGDREKARSFLHK